MFRLIESIKVNQGQLQLLEYHEKRMNSSSLALWKKSTHSVDFKVINQKVSELKQPEVYKLRISYSALDFTYEIIPYKLKNIQNLFVVEAPELEYEFKFENRKELDSLYDMKDSYDDILITRNGAVCDSLYCNVAFLKASKWYTPDMPLLNGTKREFLLETGQLMAAEIFIEDIPDFENIRLFNALIEFGEIEFPVYNIFLA